MAEVKTIDITSYIGNEKFPVNENDVYDLIETIASQNIRGLKSANRLEGAFYDYNIENGSVIEEAVIEMANAQAFEKNTVSFAATDPVVHGIYFNNWDAKQYLVTVRRDDIRKIIANKGVGVEDVVTTILDTLTQGEGHQSFLDGRNLLLNAPAVDYSPIIGGVPLDMKGVLYTIRDMYEHVKSDNSDLTGYEYVSSVPEDDIMIAVSSKVFNLIDVAELAHVFNLEKEALMGKIITVPVDDVDQANWYKIVVYDRKAMGHGRRLFDITKDTIGKTRYTNYYLTTDDCWFFNKLFKATAIDVTEAAVDVKADLIGAGTSYTVTNTLVGCKSSNPAETVNKYQLYNAVLTADEGYTLDDASASVAVTMGSDDITESAYDSETHLITIPQVTGNLTIAATAVAEG